MRGKTFRIGFLKEKDRDTGVVVTRLTDGVGNSIHPYFTQTLVSEDSKMLLIESTRSGRWQLFSLELNTGLMVQLTDDFNISPHRSCLDPKRLIAYYWDGRILKSVDLQTLKTEQIYVAPYGFHTGILSLSGDGRYLAFVYSENLEMSTGTGAQYSQMLEHLYRRPSSVIMRIDLEEERIEAVWGEREWISHVNISPVDPNIILFCHEGPWHLVQRMWIVRADTHEIYPILEQKRYIERAGHEYFTKSGKIVTQYSVRETPRSTEWTFFDVILDTDGTILGKYKYPGPSPTHIQTNPTEDLFVGDGAFPTSDFKDGRDYIGLIKHSEDMCKVIPLCHHGSSWLTQESHPHPIFTPDGKNVIFTSDREGVCNVYMTPVIE
ncbi:MAG: oligogalacturonate lyase family protein [bacterium]